jgi:UDP-N-acetylglucosamine/UDP-N-acetylgalactosamine diphosphorylase
MDPEYAKLRRRAQDHGQGHIFRWWDQLDPTQRARLLSQAAAVDFSLLDCLIASHVTAPEPEADLGDLEPAEPIPLPTTDAERAEREQAAAVGEEAIRAGRVAALVVAGGQGTRLGCDGPKGTFPASPITGKSLFQLHAEKILAARRRYAAAIPWYIMTSEANDAQTRRFFADHGHFGLPPGDVVFFQQGSLPAVDLQGKILLAARDRLATSANGHGGTLGALRDSGALDDMRQRGIRAISYFQVDNVLIRIVDPVFLGFHIARGSDFSSKALPKRNPEEGLAAFCHDSRGRLRAIEYSDLPDVHKEARRPDDSLRFEAGSIAIHALSVGFIERMTAEGRGLPYHRALKKVPCIDAEGREVAPEEPNGVKFEMFIFDALAAARTPVVLMVERAEEFAPIKCAEGEDSPATAREAQIELFARWLEEAGVCVPRGHDGKVDGAIEISPLVAASTAELRERYPHGLHFERQLNLQP